MLSTRQFVTAIAFRCRGAANTRSAVSFAPSGLLSSPAVNTHGLRRGLHSFAASRLLLKTLLCAGSRDTFGSVTSNVLNL